MHAVERVLTIKKDAENAMAISFEIIGSSVHRLAAWCMWSRGLHGQ